MSSTMASEHSLMLSDDKLQVQRQRQSLLLANSLFLIFLVSLSIAAVVIAHEYHHLSSHIQHLDTQISDTQQHMAQFHKSRSLNLNYTSLQSLTLSMGHPTNKKIQHLNLSNSSITTLSGMSIPDLLTLQLSTPNPISMIGCDFSFAQKMDIDNIQTISNNILGISQFPISWRSCKILQNNTFPHLRHLSIQDASMLIFTSNIFILLDTLTLRNLSASVIFISNSPCLRTLCIDDTNNVLSVVEVKHLQNLTHYYIGSNNSVTVTLNNLSYFEEGCLNTPKIHSLHLDKLEIGSLTDTYPKLVQLTVNLCPWLHSLNMSQFPNLTSLSISNTPFQEFISHSANNTSISNIIITNTSIEKLTNLHLKVHSLSMYSPSILSQFSNNTLPNLDRLVLPSSLVTFCGNMVPILTFIILKGMEEHSNLTFFNNNVFEGLDALILNGSGLSQMQNNTFLSTEVVDISNSQIDDKSALRILSTNQFSSNTLRFFNLDHNPIQDKQKIKLAYTQAFPSTQIII